MNSSNRTAPLSVRMGFAVDVVGYSRRTAPAKIEVQERVAELIDDLLSAMGLSIGETHHQASGDGITMFLPSTMELHIALPYLLRATDDWLRLDNERRRDRLRLRMATVVGPVGPAALGLSGNTVIECNRLVDSTLLRNAMVGNRGVDVMALVSDQLYSYVIGEGHPGLSADEFLPVVVRGKNFRSHPWLWTATPHRRRRFMALASIAFGVVTGP